jgi:SAM-dependent methyltransferase
VFKKNILSFSRGVGLEQLIDRSFYLYNKILYSRSNKDFLQKNPHIPLPPAYMLYEAYKLNYKEYWFDGLETAKWVLNELKLEGSGHEKILEWGCGPARIVRHLPHLLGNQNNIYATDYNQFTINWCNQNIIGVHFDTNAINPPLQYPANFFSAVYGISIFTHLSEKNHENWLRELYRITKPGGLLLITTQGLSFLYKLSPLGKEKFKKGEIVERVSAKEGHRTFSSFQPVEFMENLLKDKWLIKKLEQGVLSNSGPQQDVWVLQKK